jgi:hypothetical protein
VNERFKEYGFEPCEGGPDKCEVCSEVKMLFFGDRDYWDSREGRYVCAECLQGRIASDNESVGLAEASICAFEILPDLLSAGCKIAHQDGLWCLFDRGGEGVVSGETFRQMCLGLMSVNVSDYQK